MSIIFLASWLIFLQSIVPPDKLPETIAFLLGAFSSIVVQFVKSNIQSVTARFAISLLLSAAVGLVSYFLATPEDTNLIVFVVHVFAYSQLAYNMFWKVIWEQLLGFKKFGHRQ